MSALITILAIIMVSVVVFILASVCSVSADIDTIKFLISHFHLEQHKCGSRWYIRKRRFITGNPFEYFGKFLKNEMEGGKEEILSFWK